MSYKEQQSVLGIVELESLSNRLKSVLSFDNKPQYIQYRNSDCTLIDAYNGLVRSIVEIINCGGLLQTKYLTTTN